LACVGDIQVVLQQGLGRGINQGSNNGRRRKAVVQATVSIRGTGIITAIDIPDAADVVRGQGGLDAPVARVHVGSGYGAM